jgi:hypothetical protein
VEVIDMRRLPFYRVWGAVMRLNEVVAQAIYVVTNQQGMECVLENPWFFICENKIIKKAAA